MAKMQQKKSDQNKPFKKVSILGLGLMGGCLALELKRRRLAEWVVGYNRSAKRRLFAKQKGICDEVYANPQDAVRDADLIVFATPVGQISKLAKEMAPEISPGAIVTDLGSTKEYLVKRLSKILPKRAYYVGSHPMAGTEKSGVESAVPDLFKGRWWFFTPTDKRPLAKQALIRLENLVKALGATPKRLSPQAHDAILAAVSHLPQLVASNLMKSVQQVKQGEALKYVAGGFLDTTRIAASPAQMWTEICLDNGREILKQMKIFEKNFERLKKMILVGNAKQLNHFFEEVSQAREKLTK